MTGLTMAGRTEDPVDSMRAELAQLGELLRETESREPEPSDVKRSRETWRDNAPPVPADPPATGPEEVRLHAADRLHQWRKQLLAPRQTPAAISAISLPDPGPAGPLPTPASIDSGRPAVQEPNADTTTARREIEDCRRSKDIRPAAAGDEPDVLRNVLLQVELIEFLIEGLRAHVSEQAQLADLAQLADPVKLSVGADAGLDRLKRTIEGLEVKVLLKVRLQEVRSILDKALTVLGENPEILLGVLKTVDTTLGEVAGVNREAVGPGGAVGILAGEVGGALGNLTGELGGAVREAVGSGDAVGNLTGGLGETAAQAMGQVGQTANQALKGRVDQAGRLPEETATAARLTARDAVDHSKRVDIRAPRTPRPVRGSWTSS